MQYLIGQAFGVAASAVSVLNPIYRKKWMMMVNNAITNIFYGLNLIFLGELGSGIFLFAVAAIQSFLNMAHALADKEPKLVEKLIFLFLYLALGFYGLVTAPGFVPGINLQNLRELLPICGAVCSMSFIFARKEQTARLFLLSCDSFWTIYYLIIGSTGIIGTAISMVLCITSLIRYRNTQK